MKVLIIGGTGLISAGIVTHLIARGAEVSMYNRGARERTVPSEVALIQGDRNQGDAFAAEFRGRRYDAVIDMICFTPEQAEATVRTFGGRCEHLLFCSTVCTYGVKVPPQVLIDERFPQEPISGYGRGKVACEGIFRRAHDRGDFKATILRPSHTYGPGGALIDQLEFDACSWDRIERGLPVIVADGGMGLWQSTHRDDCGQLFAYAALNPATYGEDYNATRDEVLTWRDYYEQVGRALGKPVQLVTLSADRIVALDPQRFGLLKEITRFHGAYTSAKAKRDVPEFRCVIGLTEGAAETFADVRRRGAWRKGASDAMYQRLVDDALAVDPPA
ncbi:MAG: NAD-dependent epimerase/dehydratase family protein [Planctomycetes bacterium]|nr:NAD-dependent epimerase/dehydratase family protein [Planctomycetota bacterium]